MAKLQKYTLSHDKKNDEWKLTNDKTDKVVKTFENKSDATAGGVLKKILGDDGGSVKIKKIDNKFQEERTYPKEDDPTESKG